MTCLTLSRKVRGSSKLGPSRAAPSSCRNVPYYAISGIVLVLSPSTAAIRLQNTADYAGHRQLSTVQSGSHTESRWDRSGRLERGGKLLHHVDHGATQVQPGDTILLPRAKGAPTMSEDADV